MSDGLSQLAQRGRRTRDIPPPRNPARAEPVRLAAVPDQAGEPSPDVPASPAVAAAPEDASAPAREPQPVPAAEAAAPTSIPEQTRGTRATAKAALKVVTIYLEQDDDDFLETITHTGRTSRPKTAISRSAVVRLALERLHAQMSPNQIVEELRPRGDQHGTGRKRR